MNENVYQSGEIFNNIFDELDKTIRVEASSDNPLYCVQSDKSKRVQSNTMFGEGIVSNINWDFNSSFCYQGDSRKLSATVLNGATISNEDSKLKLSSGTASNGSAIASSRRALRYRPAQEGIAGFTFQFPNRAVGNIRYIGLIDETNGFAFGIKDLEFGIFYKRGGVLTFIPQSTFNIDKIDGTGVSKFNINTNYLNIARITYGYFGIAPPTFEIFTIDKGFIPVHKMDFINNTTNLHITLPYIKFGAYNINTGNTTNLNLYSGSLAVGTIGDNNKNISTRDFTVSTGELAITGGVQRVVVFQNKEYYGVTPVINKVESLVNLISASTDTNRSVTLKRYRLATAPTGGTWTDVSADSIMRYSTDATISLVGAELSMPIELQKVGDVFETVKIEELNIIGRPNEYAVYVIETQATSGYFKLSVGWKELF